MRIEILFHPQDLCFSKNKISSSHNAAVKKSRCLSSNVSVFQELQPSALTASLALSFSYKVQNLPLPSNSNFPAGHSDSDIYFPSPILLLAYHAVGLLSPAEQPITICTHLSKTCGVQSFQVENHMIINRITLAVDIISLQSWLWSCTTSGLFRHVLIGVRIWELLA